MFALRLGTDRTLCPVQWARSHYIARNGLLGAELDPATLGAKVADVGGAYVGVMGILAALLKRAATGEGDYVDVAFPRAAMPFALIAWVEACINKNDAHNLNWAVAAPATRVSRCRGERVALGAVEEKFWANFCHAVGKSEWIAQRALRARQPALIHEVAALFKTKTAAEWADLLEGADCLFLRALSRRANCLRTADCGARYGANLADGIPWMRTLRLSGDEINLQPAPQQGEHTREVLQERDFSEVEIKTLLEAGVIRQSP